MKKGDNQYLTLSFKTFLLSYLVLIGALIYAFFFHPKFENPYPLLDISRNFLDQNDAVVNFQPLREELNSIVAKNEGQLDVSLYFEYLNTGANIAINPDMDIWPVNLGRLPLAMAVMKKIENGDLNPEARIAVFQEANENRFNENGDQLTAEQLLKKLLNTQDLTAYRAFIILFQSVKGFTLDEIIGEVGLDQLFKDYERISAKEYSRLFRSLYVASFLNRENSQKMLKWLSESGHGEFLGKDIPEDILFSHKMGENAEFKVFNDSGIVYLPDRPYLLTVTIQQNKSSSEAVAKDLMAEISNKIFDYVKNI